MHLRGTGGLNVTPAMNYLSGDVGDPERHTATVDGGQLPPDPREGLVWDEGSGTRSVMRYALGQRVSRLRGIRAESSRVVCSPPWCEKRALRGRGSIRPCVRSVPGLLWVHY